MSNTLTIVKLISAMHITRNRIKQSIGYVNVLGILKTRVLITLSAQGAQSTSATSTDATPITASNITSILGLDKSSASRILRDMQQDGLISFSKHHTDTRKKIISLTAHGEARLSQIKQVTADVTIAQLQLLSAKQQSDIIYYLRRLFDELSFPYAMTYAGTDDFTMEFLRSHMLEDTVFSTEFGLRGGSSELFILRYLDKHKTVNFINTIAEQVLQTNNAVFYDMQSLVKKGLVKQNGKQRKNYTYQLTAKGQKLIVAIMSVLESRVGKALKKFSAKQIKEFISLLEKVTYEVNALLTQPQEPKKIFKVQELKSEADLDLARGLFIETLYRENKQFSAPKEMFAGKNKVLGYFENERLIACAELASAKILHLGYVRNLSGTTSQKDFVKLFRSYEW